MGVNLFQRGAHLGLDRFRLVRLTLRRIVRPLSFVGLLSAALVPAGIGLWEGAAWVAFAVVRAGRLAAGPASGAAAGRGSSASAEAGGTGWGGWGGWAREVLDTTPLPLGTAWMAAGVGAGSRVGQGK